MLRLIILVFPYGLVLLGILCFSAISTVFQEVPTSPVQLSAAELMRTSPEKLPEWVKVPDGILLWSESYAIYEQTSDIEEYKSILVPLVDADLASKWQSVTENSNLSFCYMVDFDWDDFKKQFPNIAQIIKSGTADINESIMQTYEVSFRPEIENESIVIGLKKDVYEKMHENGFKHIVGITPGSEPLQKSEAVGVSIFGLVAIGVGILWLKKRKKE
ncbi:MAG: hypothetical protein JEZ07_13045 [Phycisphaerae bacterium]|nr:hypothetical protein [Phycisphaerae bacterium]